MLGSPPSCPDVTGLDEWVVSVVAAAVAVSAAAPFVAVAAAVPAEALVSLFPCLVVVGHRLTVPCLVVPGDVGDVWQQQQLQTDSTVSSELLASIEACGFSQCDMGGRSGKLTSRSRL